MVIRGIDDSDPISAMTLTYHISIKQFDNKNSKYQANQLL